MFSCKLQEESMGSVGLLCSRFGVLALANTGVSKMIRSVGKAKIPQVVQSFRNFLIQKDTDTGVAVVLEAYGTSSRHVAGPCDEATICQDAAGSGPGSQLNIVAYL